MALSMAVVCVKWRIDHRRYGITAEMMADIYNQDALVPGPCGAIEYNTHVEHCKPRDEAAEHGETSSGLG
jgi:hypothetical protein